MKKFPCIALLFMLLACVTGASAQISTDGSAQTIFDDLQTSKPGKRRGDCQSAGSPS